jgi:hypothetical protein
MINVWVPILLLIILAEIWWFGIRCTTYLSDVRDLLRKMSSITESSSRDGSGNQDFVDSGQ